MSAVAITSGSFWKPSRGPTSRMRTARGSAGAGAVGPSDRMRGNLYSAAMPEPRTTVVVLAGGTGGAKLARGMLDVVGEDLVVIANTGDDIDIYGAHVSPDPDLVSFWLADRIDERGWGLDGDTFAVMDGLRALGVDVWFNLGDGDLAWCLERRRRLDGGATPTQALAEPGRGDRRPAGACCRCATSRSAPACGPPGAGRGFQEFMIRERAAGADRGRRLRRHRRGAAHAGGARGARRARGRS